MRSFKHINGHYIFSRLSLMFYSRRNPDLPWLTPAANKILKSILKKTDQMLEFWSGRSTLWFAEHVGHLTSVENNQEWYDKVQQMLGDRQFTNVDYLYHATGDDEVGSFDEPYVAVAGKLADASVYDMLEAWTRGTAGGVGDIIVEVRGVTSIKQAIKIKKALAAVKGVDEVHREGAKGTVKFTVVTAMNAEGFVEYMVEFAFDGFELEIEDQKSKTIVCTIQ